MSLWLIQLYLHKDRDANIITFMLALWTVTRINANPLKVQLLSVLSYNNLYILWNSDKTVVQQQTIKIKLTIIKCQQFSQIAKGET